MLQLHLTVSSSACEAGDGPTTAEGITETMRRRQQQLSYAEQQLLLCDPDQPLAANFVRQIQRAIRSDNGAEHHSEQDTEPAAAAQPTVEVEPMATEPNHSHNFESEPDVINDTDCFDDDTDYLTLIQESTNNISIQYIDAGAEPEHLESTRANISVPNEDFESTVHNIWPGKVNAGIIDTIANDGFTAHSYNVTFDKSGTIKLSGVADSGSGINACNQKAAFTTFVRATGQPAATDAGGRAHQILGWGKVTWSVRGEDGQPIQFTINMAYCPTLPTLINTTALARSGQFVITSNTEGTKFTNSITNRSFFATDRHGNEFIHGVAITKNVQHVHAVFEHGHRPMPTSADFRQWLNTSTFEDQLNRLRSTDNPLNRAERDATRCELAYTGTVTIDNDRDSVMKLHHLFAHRSVPQLLAFARQHGIKLSKYAEIACEACALAKSQRANRHKPTKSPTGTEWKPLQFWGIDVSGPHQKSKYHGHKYAVGFKDYKTGTGIMIFTPDVKADTIANAIKLWASEVKHLTEEIPEDMYFLPNQRDNKRIITDSAQGFKCREVTNAFRQAGVKQHWFSPPHDQHLNGLIERWFGVIDRSAKAMRLAANMSADMWPEAWQYAVQLHDILPTAGNLDNHSPYQARNRKLPSPQLIKRFKPFGAKCWLWQPDASVRKDNPRGAKGIYIGYHRQSDSHVVISNKGVKVTSNNLIVDETVPTKVIYEPANIIDPDWPTASTPPTTRVANLVSMDNNDNHDVLNARMREQLFYSLKSALADPEGGHLFKNSVEEEVGTWLKNGYMSPIAPSDIKPNERIHRTKGLCYYKRGPDGNIERAKLRLVWCDGAERQGRHFDKSTSVTPTWTTVRTHFAMAPQTPGEDSRSMDIYKAYFAGILAPPSGERILIRLPRDCQTTTATGHQQIYVLHRNQYGMRGAGAAWQTTLWEYLTAQTDSAATRLTESQPAGAEQVIKRTRVDLNTKHEPWRQSDVDPCVFYRGNTRLIIWTDDLHARGPTAELDQLQQELTERFGKVTINDSNFFLGKDIVQDGNGYYSIGSANAVTDMLNRFDKNNVKPHDTPLPPGASTAKIAQHRATASPADSRLAQEIIGTIQYEATTTRPDLAFTASLHGQNSSKPTSYDMSLYNYTFGYLKKYPKKRLVYSEQPPERRDRLHAFTDASFGEGPEATSQTGWCLMLNGGCISWASQRQKYAALSTSESEIIAAVSCIKEVLFVRRLLEDFGVQQREPTVVHADASNAINFFEEGAVTKRNRYMPTKIWRMRQEIRERTIDLRYVHTGLNVADIFTKSLTKDPHTRHTNSLVHFTKLSEGHESRRTFLTTTTNLWQQHVDYILQSHDNIEDKRAADLRYHRS